MASSRSAAPQTESLNDIVSRIVLQHNMVDEDKLEEALELQREILDTEGQKQSLERVLLDMGILKGKQLKGLRYAIIYYLVRKADRFYGKIAVQSDICEQKWVNAALREQKRIHVKERRLVRINKILLEKGYINSRENRAILRAIEGIRERRRKKKGGGASRGKQKGKARKPAAASPAPDLEDELQDLDDIASQPIEALSENTLDDDLGVREDDPQSIEELEELSGIGEVHPSELDVDDVSEVGAEEELDATSSVEALDDLDLDGEEEDDADLDLDDDLDDDLDLDDEAEGAAAGESEGFVLNLSGSDASADEDDDDLDDADLDDADLDDEDDAELDDEDDADEDDDDLDDADLDDAELDDEDDAELDDEDDAELDDEDDDEDDAAAPPPERNEKKGLFSRLLGGGRKKKTEPLRRKSTGKKAGSLGKKTGKKAGSLGKKTGKKAGSLGKKTGKKTGKKFDTSKLQEMAKKRRSKRFGR